MSFIYYEKNKQKLPLRQKYMLAELRNLCFFESLRLVNTLLRGSNNEYKLDQGKFKDEKIKFEKNNLHHIRNVFGDHSGKDQKKGTVDIKVGDVLHRYANRITEDVSIKLRDVIDAIQSKMGGKSSVYSDTIKFNFVAQMKEFK